MKFTDLVPGTLYAYTTSVNPRPHDWFRALLIEKGGWVQSPYGSPRRSATAKDSLVLVRTFGRDAATVEEARAYPIESAWRWAPIQRQRTWNSPDPTEEEEAVRPPTGWALKVAKPQHLRMTWADYEVAAERTRKVQEEQAAVRAVQEAALEEKRQARLAALADLGIEKRWGLVDSSGDVRLRGYEFDSLLARLQQHEEVQA